MRGPASRLVLGLSLVLFLLAGLFAYRLERRQDRIERDHDRSRAIMEREQGERSYVRVRWKDGREARYYRGETETDAAWARRIVELVRGGPTPAARYQCVELTGCEGGVSLNVCELCAPGESAAACLARAEKTAAIVRRELGCD